MTAASEQQPGETRDEWKARTYVEHYGTDPAQMVAAPEPQAAAAPVLQWRWREYVQHNEGDADWGDWEEWEDIPAGESFSFDSNWEFETRIKPVAPRTAPKGHAVQATVQPCPAGETHPRHFWSTPAEDQRFICPGRS